MPANYVLLERIELNTSAASIVFANIPQSGYTDLKVVASARSTSGGAVAYSMFMKMNNLTTSIYSQRALEGSGSAASSFTQSGVDTAVRVGLITGTGATSNTFSNTEIYIPNYTSSNAKSVSVDTVAETNATTQYSNLIAYLVNSTAAITSLTFSTEPAGGVAFAANSTFSLYGLAAVGTTPVIAPKATGGNLIENDGTYWIHTFTSTGTFTPLQGLSCDALVVAGGGGGGSDSNGTAGGGGGGGFRTATGFGVSAIPYTIQVGAGGAGAPPSGTSAGVGASGTDSIFSTITSTGGGGGGLQRSGGNGLNGGSGGGGGNLAGGSGNTPSTSPSQGNNGGTASSAANAYGGGGGGGASAAGGAGSGTNGGAGGAGTANSYSGTSVTYAGGGGGSVYQSSGNGAGGAGGGGTGGRGGNLGTPLAPTAGTTNLGGGGGAGAGAEFTDFAGGNGGSGVVIIRYPIA